MYGGKSKYQRRYARKGRAVKRVAKMARGKVTAIQALAKSVRTLQRKVRSQHQFLNFSYGESNRTIVSNYEVIPLCNFSALNPIFGTSGNDGYDNKIIHQSFGIDMYLQANTESDLVRMTIFLVSLKDAIGSAFNPSTGALTLTNGDHYAQVDGQSFLNKKAFNIHKVKRLQFTNHGSALTNSTAQTQKGTDCRMYWKWSPRSMVTNPTGDWRSLSSALDPSKQYYLLIMNDNSSLDLENPTITYARVHTFKTVV